MIRRIADATYLVGEVQWTSLSCTMYLWIIIWNNTLENNSENSMIHYLSFGMRNAKQAFVILARFMTHFGGKK